jgi:hypothetical protein
MATGTEKNRDFDALDFCNNLLKLLKQKQPPQT